MRRGTTPTIPLVVKADISDWTRFVTFLNGDDKWADVLLDLGNDRQTATLEDGKTTIGVTLTQEETLSFEPGIVYVQVRAVKGATAVATESKPIEVEDVLREGVISE
jgi:hypothetical protein